MTTASLTRMHQSAELGLLDAVCHGTHVHNSTHCNG